MLSKASSVKRHLKRAEEKAKPDLKTFLSDLDSKISQKMVKAAGLRNLIIHEYAKIEAEQIYNIVQKDISDLNAYLKTIFKKTRISD